MVRKVFHTGNSLVVSIPPEALEFLHLHEGSEVGMNLDRDNRQLVLKPVDKSLSNSGIDVEFARQVAEFIEQYRPALEKLAK